MAGQYQTYEDYFKLPNQPSAAVNQNAPAQTTTNSNLKLLDKASGLMKDSASEFMKNVMMKAAESLKTDLGGGLGGGFQDREMPGDWRGGQQGFNAQPGAGGYSGNQYQSMQGGLDRYNQANWDSQGMQSRMQGHDQYQDKCEFVRGIELSREGNSMTGMGQRNMQQTQPARWGNYDDRQMDNRRQEFTGDSYYSGMPARGNLNSGGSFQDDSCNRCGGRGHFPSECPNFNSGGGREGMRGEFGGDTRSGFGNHDLRGSDGFGDSGFREGGFSDQRDGNDGFGNYSRGGGQYGYDQSNEDRFGKSVGVDDQYRSVKDQGGFEGNRLADDMKGGGNTAEGESDPPSKGPKGGCWICGEKGHFARKCPNKDAEEDEEDEEDTSFCDLCKVPFDNPQKYYSHMRGLLHIQRQLAANDPKSGEQPAQDTPDEKTGPTFCKVCILTFNTTQKYEEHIEGMLHKHRVAARQNKKPDEEEQASVTGDGQTNAGEEEDMDDWEEEWENEEDASKFVCELCDIKCTGIQAFRAHELGRNHKLVQEAVDNGTSLPVRIYSRLGPKAKIPNTAKPAVATIRPTDGPSVLLDLLKNIPEAIVGTEYVKEGRAGKNASFYCMTCESPCDMSGIITHLMGAKHRMKYLRDHHSSVYQHVRSHGGKRSQLTAFLEEVCADIEKKFGRKEPIMGGPAASAKETEPEKKEAEKEPEKKEPEKEGSVDKDEQEKAKDESKEETKDKESDEEKKTEKKVEEKKKENDNKKAQKANWHSSSKRHLPHKEVMARYREAKTKGPEGGPQTGPGGPQMGPGGLQMGPGGPQMGPGGLQMGPGGPQMGPGGLSMGLGGPQMGAGWNPQMGPGDGWNSGPGLRFGSYGPPGQMGPGFNMEGPNNPFWQGRNSPPPYGPMNNGPMDQGPMDPGFPRPSGPSYYDRPELLSDEERRRRMLEFERRAFYFPDLVISPDEARRQFFFEYEVLGVPYSVACERVLVQENRRMSLIDYMKEGLTLKEAQDRVLKIENRKQLIREYEIQGLDPREARWRVIVEEERRKLFDNYERLGFTPLQARIKISDGEDRQHLIQEFERHGMSPEEAYRRAISEENRLKNLDSSTSKASDQDQKLDDIADKRMLQNYMEHGDSRDTAENKVIAALRRQGVSTQDAILRVQKIEIDVPKRIEQPEAQAKSKKSEDLETIGPAEAKERLFQEYERRGVPREKARISLIQELIRSGVPEEEAKRRFSDTKPLESAKRKGEGEKDRGRKRHKYTGYEQRNRHSSSSSSSSSGSSPEKRKQKVLPKAFQEGRGKGRGKDGRGKDGRGKDGRGRDDRGREDRGKEDRGKEDRGKEDRGRFKEDRNRLKEGAQRVREDRERARVLEGDKKKKDEFSSREKDRIYRDMEFKPIGSKAGSLDKDKGRPTLTLGEELKLKARKLKREELLSQLEEKSALAKSAKLSAAQPFATPSLSQPQKTATPTPAAASTSTAKKDSKDISGLLESLTDNLISSEGNESVALSMSKVLTSALLKYRGNSGSKQKEKPAPSSASSSSFIQRRIDDAKRLYETKIAPKDKPASTGESMQAYSSPQQRRQGGWDQQGRAPTSTVTAEHFGLPPPKPGYMQQYGAPAPTYAPSSSDRGNNPPSGFQQSSEKKKPSIPRVLLSQKEPDKGHSSSLKLFRR